MLEWGLAAAQNVFSLPRGGTRPRGAYSTPRSWLREPLEKRRGLIDPRGSIFPAISQSRARGELQRIDGHARSCQGESSVVHGAHDVL